MFFLAVTKRTRRRERSSIRCLAWYLFFGLASIGTCWKPRLACANGLRKKDAAIEPYWTYKVVPPRYQNKFIYNSDNYCRTDGRYISNIMIDLDVVVVIAHLVIGVAPTFWGFMLNFRVVQQLHGALHLFSNYVTVILTRDSDIPISSNASSYQLCGNVRWC